MAETRKDENIRYFLQNAHHSIKRAIMVIDDDNLLVEVDNKNMKPDDALNKATAEFNNGNVLTSFEIMRSICYRYIAMKTAMATCLDSHIHWLSEVANIDGGESYVMKTEKQENFNSTLVSNMIVDKLKQDVLPEMVERIKSDVIDAMKVQEPVLEDDGSKVLDNLGGDDEEEKKD